eukprot:UN3349
MVADAEVCALFRISGHPEEICRHSGRRENETLQVSLQVVEGLVGCISDDAGVLVDDVGILFQADGIAQGCAIAVNLFSVLEIVVGLAAPRPAADAIRDVTTVALVAQAFGLVLHHPAGHQAGC